MNAKKMLALLLALAMVLGMAACGGSQQADTPAAGTTAAAATGEKPVVKFSYPVLFVTPTEEGTAHVEDALNAYLDSIGESFHVDLDPVEGFSYANNMASTIRAPIPETVPRHPAWAAPTAPVTGS